MATRIAETFERLSQNQQMAFMPFISAGDPDLKGTQELIRTLGRAGVDLIEIGFPYSDPIADGPVIQASYTRALGQHVTVSQIFDALSELKGESIPPLVAMVSYAIVFRTGEEAFLDRCVEAGISGLIVPDLPGTEAESFYELTKKRNLDLVPLIAPTTPRERVRGIVKSGSGFIYCVAVAGTTGERANVANELLDQLSWLKQETQLPLAVGFGISGPEHVEPLRGLAHGVIIGSAIVKHLQSVADGKLSFEEANQNVSALCEHMVGSTHQAAT